MPPQDGKSWRAFIQENFTALILLGILVLSMAFVVLLMHEEKIDDKYVTWFEGFATGVFGTLSLSLKGSASGQHQGDTIKTGDNTSINVPEPKVPAPVAEGDGK